MKISLLITSLSFYYSKSIKVSIQNDYTRFIFLGCQLQTFCALGKSFRDNTQRCTDELIEEFIEVQNLSAKDLCETNNNFYIKIERASETLFLWCQSTSPLLRSPKSPENVYAINKTLR